MRHFLLPILSILLTVCCQNGAKQKNDDMTLTEKQVLLHALHIHMKANITDLSETKRTPTDQFVLSTYYPLSPKELEAMKMANQMEGSFATDIADRIGCEIIATNLKNEKGEEVSLADTASHPLYIQRFGLWDYDKQLCQNVGIPIQTGSFFSELKGDIKLKLYLEGGVAEMIDIPVAISVQDILQP